MYFHVQITLKDHRHRRQELVVLDKDRTWLERHIVGPRALDEATLIDGKVLTWDEVTEIHITRTGQRSEDLLPEIRARRAKGAVATPMSDEWYVVKEGDDVTEEFVAGAPGSKADNDGSPVAEAVKDPAVVMVVYGQDREANRVMFNWLRSVGLKPQEWEELVSGTGSASPFGGAVLDHAFSVAQAVVVLFTPDEQVTTRLAGEDSEWWLQARPNVLIEAGMALVTHPRRTIMAVLGEQRIPSDLAGRQLVKLGTPQALSTLAQRLRVAGCPVDLGGADWLDASFPDR